MWVCVILEKNTFERVHRFDTLMLWLVLIIYVVKRVVQGRNSAVSMGFFPTKGILPSLTHKCMLSKSI